MGEDRKEKVDLAGAWVERTRKELAWSREEGDTGNPVRENALRDLN